MVGDWYIWTLVFRDEQFLNVNVQVMVMVLDKESSADEDGSEEGKTFDYS